MFSIKEGIYSLKRFFKGISVYLLIVLLIMFGVSMFGTEVNTVKEMDVTELIKNIKDGNVVSAVMNGDVLKGILKDETEFTTVIPDIVENSMYPDYLQELVETGQLQLGGELPPATPWYIELLPTLLIILDRKSVV